MGISVVRYKVKNTAQVKWGILKERMISPLDGEYKLLMDFLRSGRQEASAAKEKKGTVALEDVQLLSPITRPCRLLCQGVNYHKHRVEAGADKVSQSPKENLYFRKDDSTILNPHDDIKIPDGVEFLDYEVEMGVVMGKAITGAVSVDKDNLFDYVAGIVLCNDVSARDWMFTQPYMQWFKGKSPRKSSPFGPVLYLFEDASELGLMEDLHIRLWMNDELRQDSHTSKIIRKADQALTEISQWIDMEVGDVLMTGTPGGVSVRAPNPFPRDPKALLQYQRETGIVWLKSGDTLKAELVSSDGKIQLGTQENRVV